MKIGDRVRLVPRITSSFMKRTPRAVKWDKRRGTIKAITRRGDVGVKWDDRVSPDFWPPQALMVIPAQPGLNRPLDTTAPASHAAGETVASLVGHESPDGD